MHFIAVNAPPLGIRKNPNACSNISVRAPNFFLTPFRHYHTPRRVCAFKMRATLRAQVWVTFLYGATIPHRAACYLWLDKSSGARKKIIQRAHMIFQHYIWLSNQACGMSARAARTKNFRPRLGARTPVLRVMQNSRKKAHFARSARCACIGRTRAPDAFCARKSRISHSHFARNFY